MEHINEIIKHVINNNEHPISTGFKFLDTAIGGYYPGQLTTICGNENSGKTAFVIAQINYYAVDQQIPTLLVMNNMVEHTFLSCMAAYYCSIETSNVNSVLYDEQYKKEVGAYLQKLKKAPLYIIGEEWMDENLYYDKIEGLITAHDIKIVFVDEINQESFFSLPRKVSICHYKALAMKLSIPVVATCCVWTDREGIEGIKPALGDLLCYNEIHGHDIVIGLVNYEQYHIYQDENGRDLHDTIYVEILKKKGKLNKRKYLLSWGNLYLRNSADKKKAALEEIREFCGYKVDALIKKLDLTTEDNDGLPF